LLPNQELCEAEGIQDDELLGIQFEDKLFGIQFEDRLELLIDDDEENMEAPSATPTPTPRPKIASTVEIGYSSTTC